ncbi:MAG: GTPase HflX [bacterium]|nr:GTPase HflX [bacterium]
MSRLTLAPRAILIDVIPPSMEKPVAERRLLELDALTKTYGGIVVVKLIQRRALPDYRTYVGSGKLQELIEIGKKEKAELVIINNLLKPKQMFEVGEILRKEKMVVWDRVDLILKIFDRHAKTSEAKLQIKLAAIRHMGPRIFGMGMELMQQAGGTGTRGGAGETNTEIMKRHLAQQERHVKNDLERLAKSRGEHRRRRDRIGLKTVSIVGYTNAGKSSLLTALTRKGAYAANELFATLDTRIGKLYIPLPVPQEILLSDTIGFIQDLPPQLIDAFRSTLDETIDADAIMQVVDAADPHLSEKLEEVEEVLRSLHVDEKPRLYAFNKIDLLKKKDVAALKKAFSDLKPVFVSSQKKLGLEELKQRLAYVIKKTPAV